jgi:hypothetical protein
MAVLDVPLRAPATVEAERAARDALRGQIARLEREIANLIVANCPRLDPGPPLAAHGGPRVLGLGELERVRDELAARLSTLGSAADAQLLRQAQAARELEEMLRDPAAHKFKLLTGADLGHSQCCTYHVRPRLGLIGMLAGWWHVKVSSGCPLAT